MKAALIELNARAQGLSTVIGGISLTIGTVLTLVPQRGVRFLGWETHERAARFVGAADLVIGTGLLAAPRRSRWMLARAALNVVIALIYIQTLADEIPRRKRTIGGLCLMAVLTVNDYSLSRSLRNSEASYNLTKTRSLH